MRTAALVALTLSLALPAVAEAREWELSTGVTGHRTFSSSADAITTDRVIPLGDFALSAELTKYAPILGAVSAELRFQVGGDEAVDFETLTGRLDVESLRAGIVASRPIWKRVRGVLRLDGGFVRGSLEMSAIGSTGETLKLADRDYALAGYAGLGAEVALLQAEDRPLALGVRVEAGLMGAHDLDFVAHSDDPDDGMDRIDQAPAPLGSIDLSGWSVGMQLFGRW